MALSKRGLIKRSKSFFRRRFIRMNITIVDLSDIMQMPVGPVAYVPVKGRGAEGITVAPRPLGISKLFEGVL
ncbi:hypothetical protein pEaSNUABM37_00267 [Erwinia phage pEa_SNUABM_37]|nr:hypothetical protein pEaSNUABM37_00267 [Erwinia phage pEa_SNUABM_37]QXO10735.1 hypothetical protein pEaSNUABM48_00267 [Erwinia phage pEa_SNUABM_48]